MPARRQSRYADGVRMWVMCALCLVGCGTLKDGDAHKGPVPIAEPIESLEKLAVGSGHMGIGIIERDPKTGTATFTVDRASDRLAYDLKLRVETTQGYREVVSRLDDQRYIDNAIPVFYRFHIPASENSFMVSNYDLLDGGQRRPMALDWFIWLNGDGQPIKLTVYEEGGELLVRLKQEPVSIEFDDNMNGLN